MNIENYFFSNKNFSNSKKYLLLRGIDSKEIEVLKSKIDKKKKLEEKINNLRKEKNIRSKKKEKEGTEEDKKIKNKIKEIEKVKVDLEKEIKLLSDLLPNIPVSEEEINNFNLKKNNKIIEEKKYEHSELNNNMLGEEIIKKIIIEENLSNPSGSKFVIYKGEGSKLLHFLINLLRKENEKNGYLLFDLPYLVKAESLYNTGQLPKFKNDLYKIKDEDLYLVPTSEVTLVNMYSNKIIEEKDLPIKISSYSACFRLEAGKHGKENKKLFRLHQFNKVELVKITKAEESYKELKKMMNDVCKILEKLKINYRIVDLHYKELSVSSIKTYDIEIYLPNSKEWIEISSCSNCTSFQSMRGKIRVKNKKKNYNPHTLNGSSVAIDRLIIAICEYYYSNKENKIIFPKEVKYES